MDGPRHLCQPAIDYRARLLWWRQPSDAGGGASLASLRLRPGTLWTSTIKLAATLMQVLALAGCERAGSAQATPNTDHDGVLQNMRFECTTETIPTFPGDAETLFQQGRSMETAAGPKDFNAVARLYEKAGAVGHWKALQNLQILYRQGLADHPSRDRRVIDINAQLIQLGAAIGYYNMATYLDQGYGVKQDKVAALSYYRKSADMGSPYGQTHVGSLLLNKLKKREIGIQMLECAAGQGFGGAAKELAIYAEVVQKSPKRALHWAQRSAAMGNADMASKLSLAFEDGPNSISKLGLSVDMERARRYAAIEKEIERNSAARFPDIEKIVPLPPAPLPPWDGTFEYLKRR